MANPTYSCRIAFVSNPFDNSPTWVDVSNELMNFHIRRGRQWELDRMEAGTATIRLKNLAGDYWPNNTTGAHYPNVLPWKRINIQASYPTATTTYDIYTGYIESWQPTFILKPIKAPVIDLVCSDGIKNLSLFLVNNSTGYSAELSGTRVDNVLTSLGWPSTMRTINTGQSTMQATGALSNINAMTHLFTVEDSELGIIFESPSGSMIFQDRHARLKAPYITSQVTFGDTLSTDKGYSSLNLSFEDLRIYNDIRVTRLDGVEQVATSTTSKDSYGTRSLQRPSLLMNSDADALAQAQYLLGRYKAPAMRCKQIEIKPNYAPTTLYPIVLSYDLSTRITVKLNQASLNKDYHIDGIYHDWDIQDPIGLITTWMLSDALWQTTWVLDDATYSVLDTTTIPAY